MAGRHGLVAALVLVLASCSGGRSEPPPAAAEAHEEPAAPEPAPQEAEPAPEEPAPPSGPVTAEELERARQCAVANDNPCVLGILRGRAETALERALVIDALMASIQMTEASREMREFVRRYPNDSRTPTYRQHMSIFPPE